jgi:hypothetical protein
MRYANVLIVIGCVIEAILLLVVRHSSGASLVNFGPAVVGLVALVLGLTLTLTCVILGVVFLFRRRWQVAGYFLLTSTAISFFLKTVLYSN